MQQIEFRAMGCQMRAMIDSDSAQGAQRLAEVPDRFAEWENALSRFRDDSELTQLNRRLGCAVLVSPTLWEVVNVALEAARRSGGLVTPTVLSALESAGYDRSFDSLPPNAVSPATSSQPTGNWRAIELEPRSRSIRLPEGARLDLGGVAKGWAADKAVKFLSVRAPALVDAGGDVAIHKPPRGERGWPVAVADPLKPGAYVEMLIVGKGGVATSGRDYRRWQKNGVEQHHLMDPRTGLPAQTDVLTVTVVAATTFEAEVAAKAALILGSVAGLAWLEARPSLAGLMVGEDGRVLRTRSSKNFIWS
ncbi:MAG: FAD:protein FMN transferase [Chloroflexi bacterium]|nr:FAD:protein FMN transferase [Chloroflexota bacterium]